MLQGRRAIEALMVDTCRITKPGVGKGPFNEATGQRDKPARVQVYEGPCRLQVRSDINSNAVEAVVAEHEWTYRTATLQLPMAGTGDLKPDYVVEMVTVPYDPSMVGKQYNMQAESKAKTHATHRRFGVREVLA